MVTQTHIQTLYDDIPLSYFAILCLL